MGQMQPGYGGFGRNQGGQMGFQTGQLGSQQMPYQLPINVADGYGQGFKNPMQTGFAPPLQNVQSMASAAQNPMNQFGGQGYMQNSGGMNPPGWQGFGLSGTGMQGPLIQGTPMPKPGYGPGQNPSVGFPGGPGYFGPTVPWGLGGMEAANPASSKYLQQILAQYPAGSLTF